MAGEMRPTRHEAGQAGTTEATGEGTRKGGGSCSRLNFFHICGPCCKGFFPLGTHRPSHRAPRALSGTGPVPGSPHRAYLAGIAGS